MFVSYYFIGKEKYKKHLMFHVAHLSIQVKFIILYPQGFVDAQIRTQEPVYNFSTIGS